MRKPHLLLLRQFTLVKLVNYDLKYVTQELWNYSHERTVVSFIRRIINSWLKFSRC